jgi:hypothetical protein
MGLHDHWHTSTLYPQGNNPNAPWTGGWVVTELLWMLWRKDKSLALAANQQFLRHVAHSSVTVPTALL